MTKPSASCKQPSFSRRSALLSDGRVRVARVDGSVEHVQLNEPEQIHREIVGRLP